MDFDPKQYELEDTAVLTLQNLKRDDDLIGADGINPITVLIYGPGSKQGVRARHLSGRNAALRMTQTMRGSLAKNAAAEADEERAESLAMITASISNFPYEGGARAIYSNPKLVDFADQVEAFFSDKANFSKPSTTSSASMPGKAPG